ncbi:MAG: efflux RND transporter permease subunit [Lamprobacter sp.]|uniref:efflux RND transporter permease subunit n=1 Tax=Lamprobacter sp. TaxID=3100796 RepID=UPI002B261A60|nr:efflux RND transporter permease subunit [Lamprobacter sp.]MEA3642038.1 efflux RND transporter permease subunit [Lamprobacter sp.]
MMGLTVSDIANTLRGYIGGDVPTRFRDGNELFDLRVLVPERTLASRSDVEDLVLAVQFNSLRLPFVVFLAAPFCVAGIGYALLLGGQAFGATLIIAVMVVLATNVNDGVLLVETAQRLRAEGMARLAATRAAVELRLRPRLMTTLPVSLGFVPPAFALESGGELLRPLTIAAIGGCSPRWSWRSIWCRCSIP